MTGGDDEDTMKRFWLLVAVYELAPPENLIAAIEG
jgi:hypothetical protein